MVDLCERVVKQGRLRSPSVGRRDGGATLAAFALDAIVRGGLWRVAPASVLANRWAAGNAGPTI